MLLTVSVAQVALPYLVARMPKNKTTSRGSARSQLVHFSTHGCWRSSNHLFSNAPISLPRWTVSSQSAPSRDSLPSSPDIGLVPASAPSGQLDLSSMTMYSLVRFIQSQKHFTFTGRSYLYEFSSTAHFFFASACCDSTCLHLVCPQCPCGLQPCQPLFPPSVPPCWQVHVMLL